MKKDLIKFASADVPVLWYIARRMYSRTDRLWFQFKDFFISASKKTRGFEINQVVKRSNNVLNHSTGLIE